MKPGATAITETPPTESLTDGAPTRRESAMRWGAVGLFVLLGFVGILNHEMWRDEAHTWLVARHTHSLHELFAAIANDGHGPAWYLLTYALAAVVEAPVAMQVLHLALATVGVAIVVHRSPFPWSVRLLHLAGYFTLYEYSTISRNYVVTFWGILGLIWLYKSENHRPFWMFLALGLYAQFNAFGGLLCVAFTGLYLLDLALHRDRLRGQWPSAVMGFVVEVLLVAFSASVHKPDVAGSVKLEPFLRLDLGRLTDMFATYGRTIAPFPPFTLHLWNSHIIGSQLVLALIGLALLVLVTLLFSRQRQALVFFLASTMFFLLANYVLFNSQVARHAGHLFGLFLGAFWLAWASRNTPGVRPWQLRGQLILLLTIMSLQAASGLIMMGYEIRYPFSCGDFAARLVREAGVEDFEVLVDFPTNTDDALLYLNRPAYIPRKSDERLYWAPYNPTWRLLYRDDFLAPMYRVVRDEGRAMVVITSFNFDQVMLGTTYEGIQVEKLGERSTMIIDDSSYNVYLARPSPP